MTSRLGRIIAATGAAAALTFGLAACTGSVPKDDVAKSINDQLTKQNIQTQNVSCPTDLTAEVGQTVRCVFTVDEQPVDAVAKVSSVEGSTANYDITLEPHPIAKSLLERKIGEQVGQQAGVAIDSTTCTNDLAPTVDQTSVCTVAAQGETLVIDVKVTAVNQGEVNYSWLPRK